MNPCESSESMIALQAGGDLSPAESESLLQHLGTCRACQDFAAELRASQRAFAKLADEAIDEAHLASVRASVMGRIEKPTRQGSAFTVPRRRLALAATLLFALAATFWLRPAKRVDTGSAHPETHQPVTEAMTAETIAEPESSHNPRTSPVAPQPIAPEPVTTARVAVKPVSGESTAPVIAPESMVAKTNLQPPAPLTSQGTPDLATPELATTEPPTEPIVIKLVSEDADLVIYWLVQTETEPTQEKTHEISAV